MGDMSNKKATVGDRFISRSDFRPVTLVALDAAFARFDNGVATPRGIFDALVAAGHMTNVGAS